MAKPLPTYVIHPVLTNSLWNKFIPSFIDESAAVGEKSAVDGVEDSKLSESLHGKEQHGPNDHETDELEDVVSHASNARVKAVTVTYHTPRATIMEG